jgi:hypothetical protein
LKTGTIIQKTKQDFLFTQNNVAKKQKAKEKEKTNSDCLARVKKDALSHVLFPLRCQLRTNQGLVS